MHKFVGNKTLEMFLTEPSLIERFGIGTHHDGRTVFWWIERRGRLRGGQVIRYGTDGKRDKSSKYPCDWMHRILQLPDADNFKPGFCFFGEHQLDYEPDKISGGGRSAQDGDCRYRLYAGIGVAGSGG